MAKVQMKDIVRTIGDLSREPANVPTGVWELRAISLKAKDVAKKTREGEEYETVEYTLALEPVRPTASVNPEELAQIDERTGKPAYEGKRIFAKFVESFNSDLKAMGAALSAMGFGPKDDFNKVLADNLVRGKVAMGEVFNRNFKRNDGTDGTEQKVRNWAAAGGSSGGLSI